MTNKIDKFLGNLARKERVRIEPIIERIVVGNLAGMDVIKLQDRGGECRVRIGAIRIYFMPVSYGNYITKIEYRNDNSYKRR